MERNCVPSFTGKDLTVAAQPLKNASVVWVMVSRVKKPRTQWTYLLSQDEPGSARYADLHDRPILRDKLCRSYTELSMWLRHYGFTPPPLDYFAPTGEELKEGVESVIRPVTRPR